MNQALVKLIQEEFKKRIDVKTGWGKNEILAEHDKAVIAATLKFLDGDY